MKIKFLFISIFIANILLAQNLIINPSFEDKSASNFWTTSMGMCFNSPIIICSYEITNKTEKIDFKASDGFNCVSLSLFQCHTTWSDYLIYQGIKLEKGKKYELSFFITPSDSCGYYAKEIEVAFCTSEALSKSVFCSTPGKIFLQPTLTFDISSYKYTGQEGKWVKLTSTFIAGGEESTMIIGHFFKNKKQRRDASTRILDFKPKMKFMRENFCSADYYLDNFSLVEK